MHVYLRGVRLRPAVLHYIQNALLLQPERPVNENETLLRRYSNKMHWQQYFRLWQNVFMNVYVYLLAILFYFPILLIWNISDILHLPFMFYCAYGRKPLVTPHWRILLCFFLHFCSKELLLYFLYAPKMNKKVSRGGSRIPSRRGVNPGGVNIWFCKNFQKTAWSWENFGPCGPPLHPPLVSCNWLQIILF